jgi:uncharacterized membrane protein YdjX (TVP38/TMEM64 family)
MNGLEKNYFDLVSYPANTQNGAIYGPLVAPLAQFPSFVASSIPYFHFYRFLMLAASHKPNF